MGVEKNIVAIELGSSSVRAMIGQKRPDGSLQVLGFEKETTPDCIRKGVVYNIDKTIQAIASVVKRLEERQKIYIHKVYMGISGQSLRTVGGSVRRQLDTKVAISEEIVDSLNDENRLQPYAGAEILDVVPQEYRVGSHLTTEPVGIMSDRIEGCFKNVIARKTLRENLIHCLEGAKLEKADFFISPLLLSSYLLTDPEKRSGCALVDFGAETTTVAIYEKNILRHLAVIPLGGNTITADIASLLHIEFEEAENLKRTYGYACIEESEKSESRNISISNDRDIELRRLQDIIEARQQEILENVWEQVKAYTDRLLSGIIFTGGGANMRAIDTAFMQTHHFEKVKIRLMPSAPEFTTNLRLDPQSNTLATLIAMLRRGDDECTSERPAEPDLFEGKREEPSFLGPQSPSSGEGVVMDTPKTEEPEAQQEEDSKQEEEPQKPKKPSVFKRFGKWMQNVTETLVEEK